MASFAAGPAAEKPSGVQFQRVNVTEFDGPVSAETRSVCEAILRVASLREKYVYALPKEYWGASSKEDYDAWLAMKKASKSGVDPPFRPFQKIEDPSVRPDALSYEYGCVDGVFYVYEKKGSENPMHTVPSQKEYYDDLRQVLRLSHDPAAKSYSYQRLELLASRFNLHVTLNEKLESAAQKKVSHRDFYNVRKVDTHIHHSACMNQKHLLRFIKHKLKHCPNEVVIKRDGKFLTLAQVFKSLNLEAHDLSIDTIDMHASYTFHRFYRFNLKYNPIGESRLREIFLKSVTPFLDAILLK